MDSRWSTLLHLNILGTTATTMDMGKGYESRFTSSKSSIELRSGAKWTCLLRDKAFVLSSRVRFGESGRDTSEYVLELKQRLQ